MIPKSTPAGMLLFDKPEGMTSHDAVVWLRRRLGCSRVGHAGTLDPLATGLLPLCVGFATRLVDLLHGWPKTYTGRIVLGLETPTGDREGAGDTPPAPCPLPPPAVWKEARARLLGEIWQQPPAFSARKIGGTPAHRIARQGFTPVLAPSRVTVFGLRLVPEEGGRVSFAAKVSSGTYIRALARDLGRMLGTGAYLESLRRTGIGPLRVREAWRPGPESPPEVWRRRLVPPQEIPLPCPQVRLGEPEESAFLHGRVLAGFPGVPGRVRVLGPAGNLAGLADRDGEGTLLPRAVFGQQTEKNGVAAPEEEC